MTPDMAVVTPLNNFLGPEGDTVTVDEQLLNTEYKHRRQSHEITYIGPYWTICTGTGYGKNEDRVGRSRNEDRVGRRQSVEQAAHNQQRWQPLEDGRWGRVIGRVGDGG
jgi:hypothetical protein